MVRGFTHALARRLSTPFDDNLRNLGLDALQVVNLRLGGFAAPEDEPFEEPLSALAELKQQGLVQHIGLSTVSPRQLAEAQAITEIVCIQNFYNVAQRGDERFIDDLATQGIAYVPYFPLGGFSPLQSAALDAAAASLQATPMQVALAWLLAARPQHPFDSRHLVGRPSPRKSCGRDAEASTGNYRRNRPDRGRRQPRHVKEDNMPDKRIALVTGANQGVGRQVSKELAANGLTVLLGSRNFERGEEFGRLDLPVNNAAISNTRKGSLSLPEYAKITLASNASLDEVREA